MTCRFLTRIISTNERTVGGKGKNDILYVTGIVSLLD